jgi:hypothetical protein
MALIVNSRVVVPFAGILDSIPSVNLKGTDLDVYVDGVLWDVGTGDVTKDDTLLTITFDAVYIQTQRLITFTNNSGTANLRFVIKTQVFTADDVVIQQFSLSDPVPVLGTYSTAVTVNDVTGLSGTQTVIGLTPYVQPNGSVIYYDSTNGTFTTVSGNTMA